MTLQVDSGAQLDVRHFNIEARISSLFEITVTAIAEDPDLDFDAIVSAPARFTLHGRREEQPHTWTGLCRNIRQVAVHAESTGVAATAGASTYELSIVPTLWLLTQRRNHRMFQQMSELDIVRKILGEWGIDPVLRVSAGKTREYRVQYGESDYDFVCRMLGDPGISFFFEQQETETRLVLTDSPEAGPRRPAIAFRDNPTVARDLEHVTKLTVEQRVRPGRYTVRDHDTRLPASFPLAGSADGGAGVEAQLERFHYLPGAFSFGSDQGETQPHGDDRGKTRSDAREGTNMAQRRLDAKRAGAKGWSFETNVLDLAPGVVTEVHDHPRGDVTGKPLLVVGSTLRGDVAGEWHHRCEARRGDAPFRPSVSVRKPKTAGVESATVVGPAGEEIHTDEQGRVRVHFHWDRESRMDQHSSLWIHVSQPWGGAGYGGTNLPRIGQEVLVDFIGGDPDKPIITGRVYTSLQTTPYKLPANKTQSGWKSNSSPTTGGYNEIMFEDAAGRELVRMQAEKDLHKLVKNDEQVTIGHDREKLVKHDDAITVGNDRTKIIQNDENSTIGNDRTKLVQSNERHVVGANRSRTVGINETVAIGVNHDLSIGADQSIEIGGDHSTEVGGDHSTEVGGDHSTEVGGSQSLDVAVMQNVMIAAAQTITVGGAHALTVGLASAETIGVMKALTVGDAYTVNVGAAMSTTVGAAMSTTVAAAMSTTVGAAQTEKVATTKTVTVGEKIELVCGKSKMVMEAAGKITWSVDGGGTIVIDDKDILIKAGGGGAVTIIGGPNVDVNP